jgi:hypothetical protein
MFPIIGILGILLIPLLEPDDRAMIEPQGVIMSQRRRIRRLPVSMYWSGFV